MPVIVVDSVEVGERRVQALVRVPDEQRRTSCSDGFARRACDLLPELVRHTCRNGTGRDALRELADTQTAHALEHVAVELMAMAGSPRSLKAHTQWDFTKDGPGVYRVVVEFDDDLVALGAIREATTIMRWLLDPIGGAPDISAIIDKLRAVRAIA